MINVQRCLWLFQARYDLQQRDLIKNLLLSAVVLAAVMALLFRITDPGSGVVTFLYFATAVYGGGWHFFYRNRQRLILSQYLMIPATETEKWAVEWLDSLVIIPLLLVFPVLLSVLMGHLLWDGIAPGMAEMIRAIFRGIQVYLILHPILFFGAAYFRSAIVLKLAASVLLVAVLSALVAGAILGRGTYQGASLPDFEYRISGFFIWGLYSAFFWGLSWWRQREVEIA